MGLFLVIAAGSCNIYPLYLASLRDRFGYSLKELNLYGAFINIGNWVGITTGLLYDKIGPRFCCLISAIVLPSAYVVLSVLIKSSLVHLHIIILLLIGFILGQSCSLIYTSSLNTNLKNYNSRHSTAIVGIITTNVAISPSIFTTFKEAMPNMQNSSFFIFVSGYLVIITALCAWVFRIIPNPYPEHRKLIAYQNYKETKIIGVLTALNLFTLCFYLFGVIVNKINDNTSFPNVIIWPLLQSLNFVILGLEKFELWDKLLFKRFIKSEMKQREKESDLNELNRLKEQEDKLVQQGNDKKENKEKAKDKDQSCDKDNDKDSTLIEESVKDNHIANNKTTVNSKSDNKKEKESLNRSMSEKKRNKHRIDEEQIDIEIMEKQRPKRHNQTERYDFSQEINAFKALNQSKPLQGEKIEEKNNEIDQNQGYLGNLNANSMLNISIPDIAPTTAVLQLTFKQKITNPELIALFIILLLAIGSVISNLNNVQFIVTSVIETPTTTAVFQYAILYFAFNSFARIFAGMILNRLIRNKKLFYFLIVISSIGFISQILGIVLQRNVLYFSIALAGVTHGGFIAFIPVYTRTTYHINDLGIIIGLLTTGCAVGSILIGTSIFSTFYEHSKNKETNTCYGAKCFRPAYIITSVFLLICIIMSSFLVRFNISKVRRQQNDGRDQRDVSISASNEVHNK